MGSPDTDREDRIRYLMDDLGFTRQEAESDTKDDEVTFAVRDAVTQERERIIDLALAISEEDPKWEPGLRELAQRLGREVADKDLETGKAGS